MQVFVVGSFVVACTVKVARLPRPGESLDAADFLSEPGGKGFNLAVAAQRLGAAVDGAFVVGEDAFADVAAAAFRRQGFPAGMLARRPGSTGGGVGFVDRAGENCLAVSLGANLSLAPEDLDAAALARADLVMATFESPDAPIRAAFAQARARGVETLLNASPARPIDPAILARTRTLLVNEVEAADLGLLDGDGRAEPRAIEALLGAGPECLVVTRGAAGAFAYGGAGPQVQSAFAVPVVDTIGAGDAFAAGFAVSRLGGCTPAEALRRAAACGAITVGRFGALDAFPTATELDRFLRERTDDGGGNDAAASVPQASRERP
ncbi:ribokinase [Methylobacterium gregans]|uniref:Ribokinase n=2 Tax=Methylobacterium gregans TaxID=374424 RepID=A0AA37HPX5_9HYPH|nr:PfkB family carbohydrate kinase [Methylobacterium gregans]GJD79849.1 Ribokinase [Methylobacterium gregans]GLS53979.1 ribokinase [Methylobacterium gregans]